ncbi:hypothetical protein AVEN_196332-1 [Araneus ventricosus]|uniref:Uncharacterized protein n=1 Tax=Araneus ventricosus TaxID=182803 RepID=A0A4Y2AUV5_ARAVE|nr:hypothetical protein AVEN_196332-1 [Araneus ventricosus]
MVIMVVEAFVPSVSQPIETGMEKMRVQVAESLNDGFLNFGIGFEMATCEVFLQWSEEMKITWCEIRAVGECSNTFHRKRCNKSRVTEAVCVQGLSCNNRTPFESTPVHFL